MKPHAAPQIVEEGSGWLARLRPLILRLVLPALVAVLFVAAVSEGQSLARCAIIAGPLFAIALAWALWPLYGRNADPAPDPAATRSTVGEPENTPFDAVRARKMLLADPQMGATAQARQRAVKGWRIFNGAAVGVAAAACAIEYFSGINHPAMLLIAVCPLLVLAAAICLRLKHRRPSSAEPAGFPSYLLTPVTPVVFLTGLGLGWVQTRWHFELIGPLLVTGLLCVLPIVVVSAWLDWPVLFAKTRRGGVFILLVCLAFGPAVLFEADHDLDRSPARAFSAQVLNRRISHGRHSDSYHVTLSPWGSRTGASEISVSGELYDALPEGTRACIRWRGGALGTPWYAVAPCPAPAPGDRVLTISKPLPSSAATERQ